MSILKNSLVSPTRAAFKLQRTTSPRSILKRPGALPRSPAHPLTVCFSIRPLERTYVTALEDFKLSAPPRSFRSITAAQNSPAITDFEDPRSPKPQPAAKQRNVLRFAPLTSNQTATRPSRTLVSSLASYPRSPYPSAPIVPTEHANDVVTVDSPTYHVRASSLDIPKRNKKGLTLSPSVTPAVPAPSSLGRSVFSPFINEGQMPVPLDLESRLNEAFWNAVSLEESDDEAMYTALEYPSSAEEPRIMNASGNGALRSPAMPKPGEVVSRIRESLTSPSSFGAIVRKNFTAPTPNDPIAAFPSFAAAMEVDRDNSVTYASRVVLE